MKPLLQFTVVTVSLLLASSGAVCRGQSAQTRPAKDEASLRSWLQNMVWHHRYTTEEIRQVTGLTAEDVEARLQQYQISEATRPARPSDRLFVLPYPGGRHPRIGFLDGAIDPLRETKLSVFCPWDDRSYVVMDVPEAIWSNLGLTWLAHTHIPTIWDKQGTRLESQEWDVQADGSFVLERRLPNGIVFGTKVIPQRDHLRMKMWLTNGTPHPLTDLRVQNCVMLKGAEGFTEQTNDNKQFINGYAVAGAAEGTRWIITGWDPIHRAWGNAPCPCLHSDPKFPDCAPGETQWLRGWFSFFQGTDIQGELDRIEATGWRKHPLHHVTGNVTGRVRDSVTGALLPCRLYVRSLTTGDWHFARSTAVAGSAVEYRRQAAGNPASTEQHVTLSADPFQLQLPPGRYQVRAERGKEYVPQELEFVVEEGRTSELNLSLRRFVDMSSLGWYSGDTHVHRKLEELPNLMLAEDLNVALPLTYWVRDSTEIPAASGPVVKPEPVFVDPGHVIYPVNTEYEIFSVNKRRHTQGAVFVLNHQAPLNLPAPPALPVAEEARRQGALLDLDKHSWNWSMMIVPIMNVDLFELSNNHHWRTQFGFPKWTLEAAPDWEEVERNEQGYTERGWTMFGLQTYYALLNCGYRLRVTGGTGAGVHPVPLGHGRVYVYVPDGPASDKPAPLSYARWISQLNAGRSFVTTGPLLDLRFQGELPGTTWSESLPGNSLRITGRIFSRSALKSVEVVANGRVVQSMELQPVVTDHGTREYQVDTPVPIQDSTWVAVRCFEDLPEGKVSFAHTNPVFVDIAGRPVKPRRREVAYFVKRMDDEIARNSEILTAEALAEYRRAREIYGELLEQAVE